jgi:outer membrane protein OmpA-like peptidoglycan-associated protein
MRLGLAAALLASLGVASGLAAGAAKADPAYRAETVVAYFLDADKRPAICLGTPAECPPLPTQRRFVLVNFRRDSSELTLGDKQSLEEFAKALKDPRLQGRRFEIDGHSDASGPEDHNLEVSRARAAAVAAYLTPLGVSVEAIKAFGSAAPLAASRFAAENRRVEARMYANVR